MMREHVLKKLDRLLEEYKPCIDQDDCVDLRYELQDLFNGDLAPYADFYRLRYSEGQLIAMVFTPGDPDDAEEWCAAFEGYVEGRIVLEPMANPTYTGDLSISVDMTDAIAAFAPFKAAMAALSAASAGEPMWLGDRYTDKKARKLEAAIKDARHRLGYRAHFEQRGSKGKRKRW